MRAPSFIATLAALTLGVVVGAVRAPAANADGVTHFDWVVHAVSGTPQAFIEERLATSNRLFTDARVAFSLRSVEPLGARHAAVVTREDRDALGAYATPGAIDVFVVASLTDVDTPPLPRRGVHWRDRTRPRVRYVIVIASSSAWVLPHELGHYFGNGHSAVPGNIMSYERGPRDPSFDPMQLAIIRRRAHALLGRQRPRR